MDSCSDSHCTTNYPPWLYKIHFQREPLRWDQPLNSGQKACPRGFTVSTGFYRIFATGSIAICKLVAKVQAPRCIQTRQPQQYGPKPPWMAYNGHAIFIPTTMPYAAQHSTALHSLALSYLMADSRHYCYQNNVVLSAVFKKFGANCFNSIILLLQTTWCGQCLQSKTSHFCPDAMVLLNSIQGMSGWLRDSRARIQSSVSE